MTAEPNFAADRSARADRSDRSDRDDRDDLSSAFGRPATSSLRGLLPPRPRRSTEHLIEVPDDVVETVDAEPADAAVAEEPAPESPAPDPAPAAPADAVPAPRTRRRDAAAAGGERSAPPAAGVANRRWGTVRLASREHVELLVLVALRRGPADGRELAARLREDSGGGLVPPPTTVQRTLHHLARHGLVARDEGNDRRFRLTPLGTRIGRARVRAWHAMRRAVDSVVRAADEN
ncbi:PadR family transcriptional regulator [Actinomycetospora flava]|uniref:PadR family transcriptional regulator n=1 Tax=Actinomycetospora flava TaxID=3129232 RepID=A0ABU8M8W6_9PSEU